MSVTTTKSHEEVVVIFKKDDRSVVYHHDLNDNMYFKIIGYPDGQNIIPVNDANSMNFFMNLLAEAGYDSNEAII